MSDAQPAPPRESPLPALDLSRHHTSPVDFDVNRGARIVSRQVTWNPPSPEQLRAWNNADDATRDGAYSVCLAAVEVETGFVAVARAETRTGRLLFGTVFQRLRRVSQAGSVGRGPWRCLHGGKALAAESSSNKAG